MPVKDPVRRKEIANSHYHRNKQRYSEYRKKYYQENPDKKEERLEYNRIYSAEYRIKNREIVLEKKKDLDKRRILFKNKRVAVDTNPRTGKCFNCGKIGLTNLHHTTYHEEDPLKDTIELCVGCHRSLHKKK